MSDPRANSAGYQIIHETQVFARLFADVIEDRYRLVDRDGIELPTPGGDLVTIPVLGSGGFGAVVRAKDRIELDRALKFMDTKNVSFVRLGDNKTQYFTPDHAPSAEDAREISERFQAEIRHTNARPFKNIVPIIDYGRFEDSDGRDLLYYVSPFIQGCRLDKYFQQHILTESVLSHNRCAEIHDLLLALVDDVLAGIEELQDAGVVHMDLKPANIMISSNVDLQPPVQATTCRSERLFIIDLGAARSARLPADTVPLVMTPYYFPRHLLDELKYRQGHIDYARLMKYGLRIDLFATGRTLEQVLLDRVRRHTVGLSSNLELQRRESMKEQFFRAIVEDDFDVLEGLIDRLMNTGEGAYRSASDARLAFQALARRTSHSVFASRVLTDQAPGIRIRVGKALVRVAPPFGEIVDHPTFQRLKKLQQLVLLSEIFPDATHTRFAHVVHTFHVAKRFIRGLYRDVYFRMIFTQRDVDHVLAAALVHDIGQYPFSHTIEDLRRLGDLCSIPKFQAIKYDQELAAEYINRSAGSNSIAQILVDSGFDVGAVLYLFQKTRKDRRDSALNIGRDIISGVIDVDRVSYLLGDSDRSGMSFGAAMDVDGLVEALCVRPGQNGDAALAIEESGVSSVEAMLTAVYWMYRNVYWRHTNRGFMAAVKFAFQTLIEAGCLTFDEYKDAVYEKSDWDALAYLHQRFRSLAVGAGSEIHNPLSSILEFRRFGYKRVFSLGSDNGKPGELYHELASKVSPKMLRDIVAGVSEACAKHAPVRPGDVLVDIPLKKRFREALSVEKGDSETVDTPAEADSRRSMWVKMRAGTPGERWQDLNQQSPLAALLSQIEDHSGRKIRVFISRDLMTKMPPYLVQQGVVGHVARVLKDVANATPWPRGD